MAKAVSLEKLIQRSKVRADMDKSRFVTDEQWTDFVNRSIERLYDILVAADQDYYTEDATITVDGSGKEFDLPEGFYKLVTVDHLINGSMKPMKPFQRSERDLYSGGSDIRYRIKKNKIVFSSAPAAQDIPISYIPSFADLVDMDDEFDGVNGWDELVILDAAIKGLNKAERDPSALMRERDLLKVDITKAAQQRDHQAPARVQDVSTSSRLWSYDLTEE